MLVDSHCHLDSSGSAAEREAIIARARSAGVETMLTISTRLDEFGEVLAIAEADGGIWCSVGAHPHEAKDHTTLDSTAADRGWRSIRKSSGSAKPGSISTMI